MKSLLRLWLATLSLLLAGTSFATFHTFRIDEVHSNGDGSVQFVVPREAIGANGNAATFAYTVDGTTQSKAIARQMFVQPGTACR